MKAVVQDRYGPAEVLRIVEVDRPVPNEDEILVRVRASTVSQSDVHLRAANPFIWRLIGGLRRPRWRSLGAELAGEVEAVGANVTEFKVRVRRRPDQVDDLAVPVPEVTNRDAVHRRHCIHRGDTLARARTLATQPPIRGTDPNRPEMNSLDRPASWSAGWNTAGSSIRDALRFGLAAKALRRGRRPSACV